MMVPIPFNPVKPGTLALGDAASIPPPFRFFRNKILLFWSNLISGSDQERFRATDSDSDSGHDADLVRSFQKGDRFAFDRLVRRHQDRVVNLCYWMLSDYEEACDMAQEVFIKAMNGLENFRFKSSFSTWLYRVTVNACKNRKSSLEYRFQKFRVRISSVFDPETKQVELPDPNPNPAEVMRKAETIKMVRAAIEKLPETQRTVVVLCDIEGLSYEKIARVTGEKIGTVKSRLARGRKNLLPLLKELTEP